MLSIVTDRSHRDCDAVERREFLKIGALGAGALTLPGLLAARAAAKAAGQPVKDTSIVWVWLAGGPTHIETFDPHMHAPREYRSTTGEVHTKLPGVTVGGTFPRIAGVADKMAFVRSFAHNKRPRGWHALRQHRLRQPLDRQRRGACPPVDRLDRGPRARK